MACSALDVKPELDYEREEEAIYRITENLPIDMEVEDSGSLEGLQSRLEKKQYDVLHLAGHADIDYKGNPYFIMEDESGHKRIAFPEMLWDDALIENPPRLLFLSGCRTGQAPDTNDDNWGISFSRLLVERYQVPAVLGWGRSVDDKEAILAEKMLFHELSRGKTILQAVQRARYELIKNFPTSKRPAWPLLRLFSNGISLNAIVKEGQDWQPKLRSMTHTFLRNSQVKILQEGFVGRRRQIQTGLQALKPDCDKVGLLILGTAGLGKSCLAGKICERFPDHTLIIVRGLLDSITIKAALKDAFIFSRDRKGQQVLSQNKPIIPILADLCATCFKDKNYLLLLDDFEQNLEGADKFSPGSLKTEAAELLKVLLHYLPFSGKMTNLVITSRYSFSLNRQDRDLVYERLQSIYLTGFQQTEQRKKTQGLKNIQKCNDPLLTMGLQSMGCGNPLLMEWQDSLIEQMVVKDKSLLLMEMKKKQDDFIRYYGLRELVRQGSEQLKNFLYRLSVYRRPIQEEVIESMAQETRILNWEGLLKIGMGLSLVEHDQAHRTYCLTPLLREELEKNFENSTSSHRIAFEYYRQVCEKRDTFDPTLTEECIYHALRCGQDEVAYKQGDILAAYFSDRLDEGETRRVQQWIANSGKK